MKKHAMRVSAIALTILALTLTQSAPADDPHFVFPGRAFPFVSYDGMVVADFDHDGHVDVAAIGRYSGAVTVAWGDPDCRLVDQASYFVGSPTRIAAGDLGSPGNGDPDGLTDLLITRWYSGNDAINILYGLGGRDFVNVEILQTGGDSDGIVIGDFDGDGRNDFAYGPHGSSSVNVTYGGPTGFETPVSVSVGGRGYSAPVSADFNGDGRADLVVCFSSPTIGMSVLYGQPTYGEFTREEYTHPGAGRSQAHVGDFDGDGQLDVALAAEGVGSRTVYVFYGKTDGSFTETPAAFPLGLGSLGTMAVGDVDGDGRDDIVASEERSLGYIRCSQGLRSVVLYGRSNQQFSEPVPFRPGGLNQAYAMAIGDIDNDGRGEVVICRGGPMGVSVHRSRPRGLIATALLDYISGVNPVDLVVADFDKDDNQDLALADQDNDKVILLRGLGTGSFERRPDELAVAAGPSHIVAADLDDDEFLDLAVTNSTGTLTIWHGAEDGQFPGPPEQLVVGAGQSALIAGDFNNDDRTDLALLGSQIIVMLGKPGGTLDSDNPISHPLPYASDDMVAGHLNADNWLDLAVAHSRYDGNTVSVFYGEGDGSFRDGESYFTDWSAPTVRRITAGDINADGLVDLITAWYQYGSYNNSVALLMGQPGGGFLQEDIPISSAWVRNLYVDDFDRDGVGDIAMGTSGTQFILFGREEGGLDVEGFSTLSHSHTVTAVGDFDNDGRPDVVGASHDSVRCATSFLLTTLNQSTARIPGELAVTAVNAPETGVAGDVVTVQWTVGNQFAKPITAKWVDAVYLSRDTSWDIDDMRLGQYEDVHTLAGNGEEGDSYTKSLEVALPGTATESWYILVRTDATDQIAEEFGEIDNVMASPIAMALPQLPICQPNAPACPGLNDTFTPQRRAFYYKLEAAQGEDLLITLAADPNEGANELYIRYGAIPTRSNYDAKYQTPFAPDQTARIPGTQDGTYYVLAYAESLPPDGNAPFNIRAEYLAFEFTSVSPDGGGNVGNLTVKLNGSSFTENITAKLISPFGDEYAALSVYFEDMSSIWATFPLSGLGPGAYDVQLLKSATTATLPGALVVTPGGGPQFEARLDAPSVIRKRGMDPPQFSFFVEYENNGNVDMEAPMLIIDGDNPIWIPDDPTYKRSQFQIMGISFTGPAGVLRGGTRERIELYTTAPTHLGLRSITQNAKSFVPIDWELIWSDVRPSFIDEEYWEEHWLEIVGHLGLDWRTYVSLLAQTSTSLTRVYSRPCLKVHELFESAMVRSYTLQGTQASMGGGRANTEIQASSQSYDRTAACNEAIIYAMNVCSDGTYYLSGNWLNTGASVSNVTVDCWTGSGDPDCYAGWAEQLPIGNGTRLNDLVPCLTNRIYEVQHSTNGNWHCEYTQPLDYSAYNKALGADCAHFVSHCLSAGGLNVHEPSTLGLHDSLWNQGILEWKERISELEPGDLVLTFRVTNWGIRGHSRIYLGGGQIAEHSGAYGGPFAGYRGYGTCFNYGSWYQFYHINLDEDDDDEDDTDTPDPDTDTGDDWGPPNIDTDGDGVNDAWDLDGDGKADAWDRDGDGIPECFTVIADRNGDGIPEVYETCGDDTDGDGCADSWDLDGDGDYDTFDKDGDCQPDPDDPTNHDDDADTGWISSWDPNRKLRRAGFGIQGFINGYHSIPYTVDFENLPKGSAAALKVDVNDFLDPNLDWTTLELEEIGFGETIFKVPDGLDHYEGRVDVNGWTYNETDGWHRYIDGDPNNPAAPLVVYVDAELDIDTGVVTWSLECADPATGTFPDDPYAGFLPPNQREIFYPDPNDPFAVHPGEGYLKYSVRPKADLPTGTEIRNKASIVFDWNAAIDTDEVLNTIDADPPTSSVAPLPLVSRARNVGVEWSGDDLGSGVAYYDIYVSDDQGDYTLWLNNTTETSAIFHGENGHIYSFYSAATDNVGHREDTPDEPDAETMIDRPFPDLTEDNQIGLDDLALFVAQWARTDCDEVANNYCEQTDFNKDGKTDLEDLTIIADNWLTTLIE